MAPEEALRWERSDRQARLGHLRLDPAPVRQPQQQRDRVEVAERLPDDEIDRLPRDHFAPPEVQAGQLAALEELVDEVVGDAERLCRLSHRQDKSVTHGSPSSSYRDFDRVRHLSCHCPTTSLASSGDRWLVPKGTYTWAFSEFLVSDIEVAVGDAALRMAQHPKER